MAESVKILLLTIFTVAGIFWALHWVLPLFIFNHDTSPLIKIIRVSEHKQDMEYVLRAVQYTIARGGLERNTVILLVCGDNDGDADEVCRRFCDECGNIRLCSEGMLTQELVQLAGLQMPG